MEQRQPAGDGVFSDEIIVLEKQASSEQAPFLRRVRYWDASTQKELVFLTNQLDLEAVTTASIYKQRWQIELLFKALKQNLRIKTFVGTTANALKTQIWTALIALLAVKFLQLQAKFPWSLSRLVALLRQQLFVYRDLWLWLYIGISGSGWNRHSSRFRSVTTIRPSYRWPGASDVWTAPNPLCGFLSIAPDSPLLSTTANGLVA